MFDSADAYDRFMGRYSAPLAPLFADFAGIRPGQRVLDVGSGPGALTGELVRRIGPSSLSAVDPSEVFVAAVRDRYPEVDVKVASAEELPFDDSSFDAVVAQLVVHFMKDPVKGLGQMRRVARAGGVVAACVWDHAGDQGPLASFWQAARSLSPDAPDESELPGTREGHLAALFEAAEMTDITDGALTVVVTHPTFEEWWTPFTLGIGPAGAHVTGLDPERRDELRERCRRLLSDPPFTVTATAWAALGRA
jgi:SAM-dependent methyltransferase